jgi:DNA repair exonuclease SbcCD ATPase subunit
MNELIFKSAEMRNFLSVGNRPLFIDFDRGLNFVCGWNHHTASSNGVGKTVIFYSSILYGLFGETGRDIKQANLINYRNRQKMYVRLTIEKNGEEIVIYRGRKPNVFYYIHNGTTYQNDNVYETQAQLNKLLDISEDIFTNVFIINASDILDFIKEEGSVKLRDRFEKIFFKNIIFKKVLETVRKEYNAVQKQQELNQSKIQEKIVFLKRLKAIITSSKKTDNYEKQLEKYNQRSKELQERLMLVENKILQRNDAEKSNKLKEKRQEYLKKHNDITSKIYYYEEKIKETDEKMKTVFSAESTCPLCRQNINEHTREKLDMEYHQEYSEFQRLKKEFEVNDVLCRRKLDKINDLDGQIRDTIYKYDQEKTNTKTALNEITQEIKFFQENYKTHMGMVQEFNTVRTDLIKIRNENGSLDTEREDLTLLAQLFDNSSGGILNFFIEKVLKVLNQIILKYIKQMNMDFTFHFDSNLRLKFDVLDTLSLNNFSGGEKKIINFIVLFSLLEFFYQTLNFKPSILIIDEIADTAISSSKVDLIFGILAKFNKDSNVGVYCLSHDYGVQHNSVIQFDRIIELEKRDGWTNVKEIKYNK